MKHNIEFKGFASDEKIRRLIEELVTRIDKTTTRLPKDAVFLRVVVEKSAHHVYHVSLTLDVPKQTLAAKVETRDCEAGIRSAFTEIERQIEAYKATMRHEHLWKRIARRREIHESKIKVPGQGDGKEFFSIVGPYLDDLKNFVSHELEYAELAGDLAPRELTVEDAVDGTLLRAYEQFIEDPARGDIRTWLIKVAIQQIDAEIKRLKSEHARTVHLEERVGELPPNEEVVDLGEEMMYFYQPDQALKVEDIVPDLEAPTPEMETEINELRSCVRTALGSMSKEYRRALILHHIQGLNLAELGRALGKTEPELQHTIEDARTQLRQKLIQAGCSFKGATTQPVRAAR